MRRNSHYEDQAQDFARDVGRRADELHDVAANRTHDLAEQAGQHARRVKEQARDWIDRGARKARDGVSLVQDEALAASRRANQYVHDEPIKTAVAAAATGAIIGGLLVWLLREPRR